jgi:hypothetical protein
MKESPLKDIPEMRQSVAQSNRLLANPSRRSTVIWVAWMALLVMVAYGFWNAYAVFRRQSYAFHFALIGCFLFLARQAIFQRSVYEMLINGTGTLQRILEAGYYGVAFSIVWHNYVLGIFFFLLAAYSLLRVVKMRSHKTGFIEAG